MMRPLFRIFKLGLDLDYAADYAKVGYTNLTQSMIKEPGTLAMYVSHVLEKPSQQVVAEVYADEAAYQAHITAPHFQDFAELAKQALTHREVITLVPQCLLEKPAPLSVTSSNSLCLRLAQVTVTDSQAFAEQVIPEIQASIAKEAGVLAMYAGTLVDHPQVWYFYEVYADEASYLAHRETPHFQAYIQGTERLLVNKQLTTLTGQSLVNQGGLAYIS